MKIKEKWSKWGNRFGLLGTQELEDVEIYSRIPPPVGKLYYVDFKYPDTSIT